MDITVNVWQLAGVLGSVSATGAAVVWFFVRTIVGQYTRGVHDALAAQDRTHRESIAQVADQLTTQTRERQAATRHWDEQFRRLEDAARERERELLTLRAELPREYQRREDAIRSESIVMAKLDVLAMKLDRINQGGASS